MRELNIDEQQAVQGGFVITATVITLIASGVIAAIYLGNNLINLYLYNKSGAVPVQPSQPAGQGVNQIGNEISTIANDLGKIHS